MENFKYLIILFIFMTNFNKSCIVCAVDQIWISQPKHLDVTTHTITLEQIDRFKRQFNFRATDARNVLRHLKNGSFSGGQGMLPIGIYIYNNKFLQATNLYNQDLWSTIPFLDENLQRLGQLFEIQELTVDTSTLNLSKTILVFSSIKKLNINSTNFVDGTLSTLLRRSTSLESLIVRKADDIFVSDLSFSGNLRTVILEDLSVRYEPQIDLKHVKNLKIHQSTFLDIQILKEFNRIFSNLQTIALDYTYFKMLEDFLIHSKTLNWITIWKAIKPSKERTVFDSLLQNSMLDKYPIVPVELVKLDGKWRILQFKA